MKSLIPKGHKIEHYDSDQLRDKTCYTLYLSNDSSTKVCITPKQHYSPHFKKRLVRIFGFVKLEFALFDPEKIKEFDDFLAKETNKS